MKKYANFATPNWRDARVAEEARLESVCTSKGYQEFESPSLRAMESHSKTNDAARTCSVFANFPDRWKLASIRIREFVKIGSLLTATFVLRQQIPRGQQEMWPAQQGKSPFPPLILSIGLQPERRTLSSQPPTDDRIVYLYHADQHIQFYNACKFYGPILRYHRAARRSE